MSSCIIQVYVRHLWPLKEIVNVLHLLSLEPRVFALNKRTVAFKRLVWQAIVTNIFSYPSSHGELIYVHLNKNKIKNYNTENILYIYLLIHTQQLSINSFLHFSIALKLNFSHLNSKTCNMTEIASSSDGWTTVNTA